MKEIWKAWAFLKLGLLTDVSYKLSFAFQAVDLMLGIAAFYFLAQLLGEKTPQGYASFPFLLIGMAVNGYMTTSLVCFAQGIRGDQLTGTLKAILVTRTSPLALILLSSLYPFVRAAIDAGLYLLGGSLFGLSLRQVNWPAALLFFLVSVLAFSGLGILSATFTLVFKRGDPLLWLFGSLSWLLGGVFYPLEVLPPLLQQTAQLLPITHALEVMRAALLSGAPVAELLPQIGVLALFGFIGLPISLIGFSLGVRRARVTGTLSHY
jgi:ABC-2 type transport system permease protein